jgi:type IV pilus assembly protein PilC
MNNAFQRIRASEARNAHIDQDLQISDEELFTFTESLRDLYGAGVTLGEMLRQLQRTTNNALFAVGLGVVISDIENGQRLSEALARYPRCFGEDYCALIRAAEQSGKWTRRRDKYGEIREGILDMLVAYLRRRHTVRQRVKAGLLYPAMVGVLVVVALTIIIFYILPTLKDFFAQLSNPAQQTTFTWAVFTAGQLAQDYWYLPPLAAGLIGLLGWWSWHYGAGRQRWMHYQLRLRGIGPVFVQLHTGEVMWLMGTLFAAGMTPQEVLSVLVASTRNLEISAALEVAREYLYQGVNFAEALRRAHWIFDDKTNMVVTTAQKTGNLGTALQNYAGQLFEKVDRQTESLVKMLEPALICVAGVIIGLIAIAFYGAISDAITSIAR